MTRETRPSARISSHLRALLFVALAALAFGAAMRHADLPSTGRAEGYAREITVGASATYVTLRTLNAFLSSAQEIEVGVAFLGQASAQPLKVLEPIDDTVERIAGVVFAVMLASAAVAVALGPLTATGFALLSLAALVAAGFAATGRRVGILPRQMLSYGAFLGIGVPLAFLLSALAADLLTERTWAEHQRIVSEITATVERGALEEAEGNWSAMMDRVETYQRLAGNISSRADELIGSLLGLLAVFLVRLVVLPVVLIGGLFLIARRLGQGARETPYRRPR